MNCSPLKIVSVCFIAALLFDACSGSKNATHENKTINGDWVLKTISTEGVNGKFASKIFNEADYNCFIGSSWHFTSKNKHGIYTLDGMSKDCPAVKRNIRWAVDEPKNATGAFQFSRIDDSGNRQNNSDDFKMIIIALTDNTMQLKSPIIFEGHPAALIYNFSRK
ncbi:MAG: lipocalin family protein [Ferruginibacter sp.]